METKQTKYESVYICFNSFSDLIEGSFTLEYSTSAASSWTNVIEVRREIKGKPKNFALLEVND